MEEQKENKFWKWVKENPLTVATEITLLALSIAEGYLMLKENERVGNLGKDNRRLEGENADLKGQLKAVEKENRHLSHELNNLCYQLGKKEASNEQ